MNVNKSVMKTAILINFSANNNTGKKKWDRIRDKVINLFEEKPIEIGYTIPFDIKNCIKKLINESNVTFFISAGGDGSINYILNALLEIDPQASEKFCLGAIGLGSSNDFLKPFSNSIDGIPVKIDDKKKYITDVGKVEILDSHNIKNQRCFVVNSSLGITAEANLLFNQGDFFINRCKSKSTSLTIIYTVIKTLIRFRNIWVQILDGSVTNQGKIANISLTKSPYISGSFCYDNATPPDSGEFAYYCAGDISKFEIIRTLYDLTKGNFCGRPKRTHSFVKNVKIKSETRIALETDGEVQQGKEFDFSVLPKAIYLAS